MPTLFCDNQPAVDLCSNERINTRTKHIAVHYHFVRERNGKIFTVKHVPSEKNIADMCTKALTKIKLETFVLML